MPNAIQTIIRRATRKPDEPLNILCFPTHERYETSLAKTGHNFYSIRTPITKDWNTDYAPIPENYHLLPKTRDTLIVPPWVEFDAIISQNKACQFHMADRIAKQLQLPLISLEHTLPPNEWSPHQIQAQASLRGDINVFVSEYQKDRWGLDGTIIHTGIDVGLFCPPDKQERGQWALSVVNDWINRDRECGFSLWKEIVGFPSPSPIIPCRILGNTPGLSQAAPDIPSLIQFYQHAGVYLNTTLVSSLPTVILEAMACGCPVVSTDTCLIPKIIIEHGVNGFVGSTADEIREYTLQVLHEPELANTLAENGRKTVVEKFSQERFVQDWNRVFDKVRGIKK